jgi:hypothetical protein
MQLVPAEANEPEPMHLRKSDVPSTGAVTDFSHHCNCLRTDYLFLFNVNLLLLSQFKSPSN